MKPGGLGNSDQFKKEMAAEQQRKNTPGGGSDAECQRRRQSESEERQNYSRQWAEEIKAREGGTPSPVTYDTSSPSTAMSGAPTKQKKKITWAEFQARPP